MSRINQLLRPRVIAALCAIMVAVFAVVFVTQSRYMRAQDATIDALIGEYGRLRSSSIDLEEQINYSYTDTYIEREARGRLGLVRDGETLFQSSGPGDANP